MSLNRTVLFNYQSNNNAIQYRFIKKSTVVRCSARPLMHRFSTVELRLRSTYSMEDQWTSGSVWLSSFPQQSEPYVSSTRSCVLNRSWPEKTDTCFESTHRCKMQCRCVNWIQLQDPVKACVLRVDVLKYLLLLKQEHIERLIVSSQ